MIKYEVVECEDSMELHKFKIKEILSDNLLAFLVSYYVDYCLEMADSDTFIVTIKGMYYSEAIDAIRDFHIMSSAYDTIG